MFSDDLKQEFLENAFAMSAFAIAITRVSDGVFVFANQSALDLFGAKDPGEVEGKTSIELGIWKNEARRLAFVASARAADDYTPTYNFTDRAGRKRARFLFCRFFEVDGVEYALGASVDVTSMWEAERALAGSEAKFSTLLTQSPTAVLITTWPAAEVLELNDACSQLLGIERDSIGRRPDGSFFADSEQFAEISRCLSDERVVNGLPVNLLHVDGHEVATLLFCRRLTMNGEQYVVTQIVDLSELQRVERELAASEDKFTQLFYASQIPSALIQAGPPRAIAEVNRALEELLGYQAAELIELGDFSTLWVEPERRKEFITLLVDEGQVETTADLRSKQGEVLPLEVSASFVDLRGEQFVLITHVDLREKRLFEQELMRANGHMEQAQALARIGDYVWNLDSDVFEGSNECMRLLGFSNDRVVEGVKAQATLHEDDREMVMIATEHSGDFDCECRINPADGAPIRHLHAWGTIRLEEGERIVRGVFQDITVHKEAEREKARIAAQMQESQRLESLGILAGGIAHDFNNLLAGILGNADLALAESGLPSMVEDRLHDVVTASKRAADLTRQLLAYSGKGRFVIETANLTDLVEEMASLLEISIAKNCVLEFHLERDLPAIEVDSTQIRQVIMNLILNASEAVEHARGVVRLSTGVQSCDADYLDDIGLAGEIDPGEYVFLEVSDNGIGMDAETQARIFEPFFTTKFTGRGLGMSAVQGIIKGHFGALRVCSKLGKGTTFKVLLPVSKSTVPMLPEEVRKVTRTGSGCVLVVDDEQTVRDLIQRILQVQGYEVLLAKDGLEGIGTFAANAAKIDLVLLDLTMPDVDGDETFRRILQIKSDVKVVLMSGYNEQDATQRFVGKSLAGFLAKPFLVDDLRRKVEEVLVGVAKAEFSEITMAGCHHK